VVRGEGEVCQTPGYEPLIYNMCTSAVEYSNAYAQNLVLYLNSFDKTDGKRESNWASFVVPKLVKRFKAVQLFHVSRSGDSLISVAIPFDSILDPFLIMTSIAHEISHYCSSKIRMRESRALYFIKCIAYIICMDLHIYTDNTLKICVRLLIKNYRELHEIRKEPKGSLYLDKTRVRVERSVYRLLSERKQLEKLHKAFWQDPSRTDGQSAQEIADKMNTKLHIAFSDLIPHQTGELVSIKMHIADIEYFLKEGFADCLMVYVLDLCKDDYLLIVLNYFLRLGNEFDDAKYSSPNFRDAGKQAQVFQRAFIISSLFEQKAFWIGNPKSRLKRGFWEDKYQALMDNFLERYKEWKNGELSDRSYYNPEVLEFIIYYLKDCLALISDVERDYPAIKSQRDALKKTFNEVINADDIFNDTYQNMLQEYRKKILERCAQEDAFYFEEEV